MLTFELTGATAQIAYEVTDFKRLRQATLELGTDDFLVNHADTGTTFVLVTPSGSSEGIASTDGIRLSTRFFDGYEMVSAWEQRDAYLRGKLSSLGKALESAGIRLQLLGLTQVAQCALDGRDDVRQSVWRRLLGDDSLLTGAAAAFDYSFRVASELGEVGFFNTSVAWYQSRNITLVAQGLAPKVVRQWDGTLESEGLQLQFDFNNKRALYDGKKTWTWAELDALMTAGLERTRVAFERITQKLEEGSECFDR